MENEQAINIISCTLIFFFVIFNAVAPRSLLMLQNHFYILLMYQRYHYIFKPVRTKEPGSNVLFGLVRRPCLVATLIYSQMGPLGEQLALPNQLASSLQM